MGSSLRRIESRICSFFGKILERDWYLEWLGSIMERDLVLVVMVVVKVIGIGGSYIGIVGIGVN